VGVWCVCEGALLRTIGKEEGGGDKVWEKGRWEGRGRGWQGGVQGGIVGVVGGVADVWGRAVCGRKGVQVEGGVEEGGWEVHVKVQWEAVGQKCTKKVGVWDQQNVGKCGAAAG